MKHIIKIISMWFLSIIIAPIAYANDDVAAQIQIQNSKYENGYNSGNADAVAALHTKDARVMVSGFPTSVGKDAIRANITAETSGPAKLNLSLETTELDVAENMAYEKGRWTTVIKEEGKADITINGPYLVIWKKVDNKWLIHFDAVFSE
ncbi:YybH family protein [Pseudemcibacter aquimaris]|uniref:YybH family protein n=1 Tax=Pseudemcibacter aquimaris TaxID=2857064 RepID=UPI002012079A|nr:nuclear transport factor 2 family protein [Pseudemcibacter aquimaris]MCC3860077.1 nuclear transport factor 2 family protein [Pseudemcibacter aquimaris]WDU57406.1 nuclear transport factor 2 family protein [Pseudemcibacter aquimaris]